MSEQQEIVTRDVASQEIDAGTFHGATITSTSLVLTDEATLEDVDAIATALGRIDRSAKWWMGDLFRQLVDMVGEDEALQRMLVTGYSETALYNWMDVTGTIPAEERSEVIDFSSQIEMRHLWKADPEKFRELRAELEKERANGIRRNNKEVRKVVKQILEDMHSPIKLFDMPTTAEELAEVSDENMRLKLEVKELRVAAKIDKVCPYCRHQAPTDEFRPENQVIEASVS